jgi:hypothetical protein
VAEFGVGGAVVVGDTTHIAYHTCRFSACEFESRHPWGPSGKGLTRIFTDDTDQEQATATAGPSTALLTKYVSNFAQDDRVDGDTGKGKNRSKSRSRFLRCAAE